MLACDSRQTCRRKAAIKILETYILKQMLHKMFLALRYFKHTKHLYIYSVFLVKLFLFDSDRISVKNVCSFGRYTQRFLFIVLSLFSHWHFYEPYDSPGVSGDEAGPDQHAVQTGRRSEPVGNGQNCCQDLWCRKTPVQTYQQDHRGRVAKQTQTHCVCKCLTWQHPWMSHSTLTCLDRRSDKGEVEVDGK